MELSIHAKNYNPSMLFQLVSCFVSTNVYHKTFAKVHLFHTHIFINASLYFRSGHDTNNKTIYILITSNWWKLANIRYWNVVEYVFTYISSDSDLQRNQWTLSLFLAPMAIAWRGSHPEGNSGRLGTRLIHCEL